MGLDAILQLKKEKGNLPSMNVCNALLHILRKSALGLDHLKNLIPTTVYETRLKIGISDITKQWIS